MHHPSQLDEALSNIQVVDEPQLTLQMATKLVGRQDATPRRSIKSELERGTTRGGETTALDTVEQLMRYFIAATRELEHAVRWYQDLKAQGW